MSQKVNWCIAVLKTSGNEQVNELINLLNVTIDNLEKRNEVIHGRFYAGNDRSDNLKSGRPGVPDRQVTPDELYDLAELLFELQGALPNVNYYASICDIAEIPAAKNVD